MRRSKLPGMESRRQKGRYLQTKPAKMESRRQKGRDLQTKPARNGESLAKAAPSAPPRQAAVPVPLLTQGRNSHPSHSASKAGGSCARCHSLRRLFLRSLRTQGRRSAAARRVPPTTHRSCRRVPPAAWPASPGGGADWVLRQPIGEPPATRATAALAAMPVPIPQSNRGHSRKHTFLL